MGKASVMLVALLLVLCLLFAATIPSDDEGRQRRPGSEEVAGLRLVLFPFSFHLRLARVHSEAGSAIELVWSLELRKLTAPPAARGEASL